MQVLRGTTAQRFIHNHWRVRQVFLRRVNPRLRDACGVEMPDVLLLHYVGESDLSPGEIAGAMQVPPHAISRRLERLESRGAVIRSLDPSDARRRVLSLTPEGENLLTEARGTLDAAVGDWLERLEPDERATLNTLLERLSAEELP